MAVAIWQLAFGLFSLLAILHLYISPYTKVEESFNIQAIHDILKYGVPTSNATEKFREYFDHMVFPGAVPRTFIGALTIAGLAKAELWAGDLTGLAAQIRVRAMLGGANATAMAIFARSVQKAYGPIAAVWYVALQASQFHVWYYSSRTLPNMFSFFFSTIGLAFLLPNPTSSLGAVRRTRLGLYLITIAAVIFRSELALLLGTHCLWLLLKPETPAAKVALIRTAFIPSIIPGIMLALVLTVSVDSYFWRSPNPLWPELSAFVSNIFPPKGDLGASAWGTQPFHWYLTSALPRLLMNQILMVDLFFIRSTTADVRVLENLIPSYAYVLLYSILPHKETRFMFPIVPSLTLVAALTCARLTINSHKSTVTKLLLYAAMVSTLVTAFISHAILLPLSARNYPGAEALNKLHQFYCSNLGSHDLVTLHHGTRPEVHVHLTNLALQSGVTKFLEQPSPCKPTEEMIRPRVVQSNDEYREPIILPGDANHPALTIHPKVPKPAPSPPPDTRPSKNPIWVYDKTDNETQLHESAFWEQFDFVVVEDPHRAIGAWEIVDEVKAVGRPQLITPSEQNELQYQLWNDWTTPDELWAYWMHPTGADMERGTTAVLHAIYPSIIASPLAKLHNLAHDVLRVGHMSPIGDLTRGNWLHLPLDTKLYILQRAVTGTNPNDKSGLLAEEARQPMGLPENAATERSPLGVDKLGPLVVNKDGTLSRIDNWEQMNEQERRKTVSYLRQRNMLRLEGVEAVTE